RLVRAIVQERTHRRIESTRQLATLIERTATHKAMRIHPATRVFQALRIAVNDELGQLRTGLNSAWTVLKPGARMAVITFHSLEDRIVKEFGRKLARDYSVEGAVDVPELRRPKRPELAWVFKKAIQPSDKEIQENPRARSAQLRVVQKV
ncbi:MAG: 16S rRNA (cytosine(1402)-N(4))-methyltransferase, partial [Verrucomicrobia bacterium]|nr:16S rRNA (cytosine(1402)-N(4))-methyltransferase [Verrucomicrobiota bacterium]